VYQDGVEGGLDECQASCIVDEPRLPCLHVCSESTSRFLSKHCSLVSERGAPRYLHRKGAT